MELAGGTLGDVDENVDGVFGFRFLRRDRDFFEVSGALDRCFAVSDARTVVGLPFLDEDFASDDLVFGFHVSGDENFADGDGFTGVDIV